MEGLVENNENLKQLTEQLKKENEQLKNKLEKKESITKDLKSIILKDTVVKEEAAKLIENLEQVVKKQKKQIEELQIADTATPPQKNENITVVSNNKKSFIYRSKQLLKKSPTVVKLYMWLKKSRG
jgi:predicted RNase H-like nuclease (RuvC/YqgF family)